MSTNPHALDSAQDPAEQFEVMQPPPASSSSIGFDFDPYHDRPISTSTISSRGHVHKNGLWHKSVHIWIVDTSTSTVLLQKRSMTKDTFPGRWDISSAGHVEAGKSIVETARAECAEELGMDVQDAELEGKLAFVIPAEQFDMGGCNAYEHVFFLVRDASTTEFALGTAEVTEVQWMDAKQLVHDLRTGNDGYAPRVKEYVDAMEKILDELLGVHIEERRM